jgi:acyl-CoA thioesterase
LTAGSATEHPLEVSGTFSEDVVVERVAEGRYRAYLDHSWDLFPLPQGGVVVSFGLRAATAEVAAAGASAGVGDPAQELRTCTSVFAGQVASGALEIDVTVLRRGRSATQVSTTVRNEDETAGTTTLAVFGGKRNGPTFVDVKPPEVPRPEDCPSFRDAPPPGVEVFPPSPFWSRVEGRGAIGHPPWEVHDPGRSETANWMRFDNPPLMDNGALDPLGVLTLADRMPGSVSEMLGHTGERFFAPSADLTVHFFEPARTTWLLAHDRARWADDGWASLESTLWAEDSTLVAYATQMTLFTSIKT